MLQECFYQVVVVVAVVFVRVLGICHTPFLILQQRKTFFEIFGLAKKLVNAKNHKLVFISKISAPAHS